VGRMGVLFVERGDAFSGARTLLRARRALQAGVTVVNFPEGTNTTGDELLPFKRGMFGLARRMNVPVVPTALMYERREVAWVGDTPFVGHYLRTVGRWRSTRVRVVFGQPLRPDRFATPEALALAAREGVLAALAPTLVRTTAAAPAPLG
jgi:lyso-ornithine lipid O-acyltransferase